MLIKFYYFSRHGRHCHRHPLCSHFTLTATAAVQLQQCPAFVISTILLRRGRYRGWAGSSAGLVFVVICHNLTFVWFSAVPCSPRTHCSRSVSRPTVRQSSNIFACTKYLWETWPIMPPSPSIRPWMWAEDKAAWNETLSYSRAPGTDVTVSCCGRSLIV